MNTQYFGSDLNPGHQAGAGSHLSPEAQEAAYFEQFKPIDRRAIPIVPMISAVTGVLLGFLAFGILIR